MLNIYKYYYDPTKLPMYDTLGHLLRNKLIDTPLHQLDKADLDVLMPIISRTPGLAYKYTREVMRSRWPEAENVIKNEPHVALAYAREILHYDSEWTSQEGHENGRWPEAESTIMKDPFTAFLYAKRILQHRWEEAEPDIKTDPNYWEHYKEHFGLE